MEKKSCLVIDPNTELTRTRNIGMWDCMPTCRPLVGVTAGSI